MVSEGARNNGNGTIEPGESARVVVQISNPTLTSATNVTTTAGTPQSTTVGTVFTTRLKATVRDAGGNPVPDAVVRFTAPATGASGVFI
jgi:hypothetical protein